VCVNVGAVIFFFTRKEEKKVFSCVEKICVREPLLLAFRRHKREENERRKERERERKGARASLSLKALASSGRLPGPLFSLFLSSHPPHTFIIIIIFSKIIIKDTRGSSYTHKSVCVCVCVLVHRQKVPF